MPAHQRVCAWLAHNYKKPAIDQEWLADCSDWISSELGLDPDRDFDQFIQNVEAQLLQSNLADSTVLGSGIDPQLVASDPAEAHPRPSGLRRPGRPASRQKKTTGPTPLLVEIKNVTEIAHSAFSLLNTHQTRLDRADLGLARDENPEQHHDQDEKPVPGFPRGMLKFELSDGLTTFRAIEFRSFPQLELGTTPLGYKMFLKSTPIRNGIAFLEPSNVTLKGYRTEDHDVHREQVFLSSLKKRLGHPDLPSDELAIVQPPVNPPVQLSPAQPAHQHQPPPVVRPLSPPADFDDMYVDDNIDPDVLREMAIQIDEAVDVQHNQRAGSSPVEPVSASEEKHTASSNPKQTLRVNTMFASSSLKASSTSTSTAKISPYFTAHSPEPNSVPDIGLSPRPALLPDPELSMPLAEEFGSTSAKPLSTSLAGRVVPPNKRSSSPDSFDDLAFDMDVDDSFLEQVGMIEKGAIGPGASNKGKGKAKDTETQGMVSHNRPSAAFASDLALGTRRLVPPPVSLAGAEPSTRMQARDTERATSTPSLSGSTESFMPRSTQSSGRRLPCDPSLVVISSEDEAHGGQGTTRPLGLARRRANKERRKMGWKELAGSDVIDISD